MTTTTTTTTKISIPSNLSNTKKKMCQTFRSKHVPVELVWIWVGIPTATCANSCDHLFICKHVWNTSLSGSQKIQQNDLANKHFTWLLFFTLSLSSSSSFFYHWTSCVNPVDGIDRFYKRQFNNLLKCDFAIFSRRRPHTRTLTTSPRSAASSHILHLANVREIAPTKNVLQFWFTTTKRQPSQPHLKWQEINHFSGKR